MGNLSCFIPHSTVVPPKLSVDPNPPPQPPQDPNDTIDNMRYYSDIFEWIKKQNNLKTKSKFFAAHNNSPKKK